MDRQILARQEALNSQFQQQNTRLIAWGFAALLTLFLIGFALFLRPIGFPDAGVGTLCVLVSCDIFFAVSGCLLTVGRHRRIATWTTLIATNVVIATFLLYWASTTQRLDLVTLVQFVSLTLGIMLTGALGGWVLIVVTTLSMNLFVVYLLATIPHHPEDTAQLPLFILIALLQQWTAAAIALVQAMRYRKLIADSARALVEKDTALQLDALKNTFISTVNHDLRGPIQAIILDVAMLERFVVNSRLPDVVQRAIGHLRKTAKAMSDIISTILDARNGDPGMGTMHLESVNIADTVQGALVYIDPHLTLNHSLNVQQVQRDLWAQADSIRLMRVLANLLTNACKYSPAGTRVEVSTRATADTSIITVRDYGKGIPPEQQGLLFHAFTRLPQDLASSVSGLGLGLYTALNLIQAMNGSIAVESSGIEGEGTAFIITLPKADNTTFARLPMYAQSAY